MSTADDPFRMLVVEETDEFEVLSRRPAAADPLPEPLSGTPGVVTARLQGFDLDEQPLLAGLTVLPGEIVVGRSTVALLREHIGAEVVVLFERGDARRPIVVGVIQARQSATQGTVASAPLVSIQKDDDRIVLAAEREITLRCGDASITLTRAGKVLIKGTYVLSRSSGNNKIKGATVDIN